MRDALVPGESREAAVERLMEEHGDAIVRLCCLYLQDAALAQDAAQEVFLKVCRYWEGFRHECSEKSWLTRIALNVCKSMHRNPWFRLVDRSVEIENLPLSAEEREMPDGDVVRVVMELDMKYRVPILLRYFQQIPVEDIARMMHMPEATVRTRLRRGKEKLKVLLEKGGVML